MQPIVDLSKKRRFAILFGNTYKECVSLPVLRDRRRNVAVVAETLTTLGFEIVTCLEDVTLDTMTKATASFKEQVALTDGEVTTFFYFSGYGGRSSEDSSIVYDKDGQEYAFHKEYMEMITDVPGAHLLMMDCVNKPDTAKEARFKSHIGLGKASLFIFGLACPYEYQPDYACLPVISPFTQCIVSMMALHDHYEVEELAKVSHIELNRLYPVLSFYCVRYSSLRHRFCFEHIK